MSVQLTELLNKVRTLSEKSVNKGNLEARRVLVDYTRSLKSNPNPNPKDAKLKSYIDSTPAVKAKVLKTWIKNLYPAITENGMKALMMVLYGESKFHTTIFTRHSDAYNTKHNASVSSKTYYDVALGIAQWNRERLQDYLTFVKLVNQGSEDLADVFNPYYQCMWLVSELKLPYYRPSLEALTSFAPVERIVKALVANFEGIPATGEQAYQQRISERVASYKQFSSAFS